ncbi:MAG: FAD:protein FMN transferase [Alphaproteobacteria bacterium]|nr:FAD:protein FMN transferase [Alphaproteobacteria bacterium]
MSSRPIAPRAANGTSRRRVITILGATAGGLALGGGALLWSSRRELKPVEWSGLALGSPARIVLYDEDPAHARGLLARVANDIHFFEDQFSLHRSGSAISRLNRTGRLDRPDPAFLQLLDESARVSALSGGAFDPTVQPIWDVTAASFRATGTPPSLQALEQLRTLVDWQAVDASAEAIRFGRSGMAMTLNGIAQGFITDRVADRLRAGGLQHVLVELGETRALGEHPEGRPWRIGIPDPGGEALVETLPLSDEAIATSGGYGTQFDDEGTWHHIFDPATTRSAHRHRSVSVIAGTATEADALATAFAVMPERAATAVADSLPNVRVRVVDNSGVARSLGA